MYHVRKLCLEDEAEREKVVNLLAHEGLRLDAQLDCTYGVFDNEQTLVATGSAYKNTLRCIAVKKDLQGQHLLPLIMSSLVADRNEAGFFNLFIYTKCEAAPFFERLGFYPVLSVDEKLSFLENKKNGFARYLASLEEAPHISGTRGAVVINANPFTKGHAHLIEQAAAFCSHVYVFIVSDSSSIIPCEVRERLIRGGTAQLTNISYHKTGDYLISSATFPAYFFKDSDEAITAQASLDAAMFIKIAHALTITHRFVGEEPFSHVTSLYNRILQCALPKGGIRVHTVVRATDHDGVPISASRARLLLQQGDFTTLAKIVPQTTLRFFQSQEGRAIVEQLRAAQDLVHY